MLYFSIFFSIFEVLLVLIPTLFAIVYIIVAERKTMASMQKRLGLVGHYRLLLAFT